MKPVIKISTSKEETPFDFAFPLMVALAVGASVEFKGGAAVLTIDDDPKRLPAIVTVVNACRGWIATIEYEGEAS